MAKCKTIGCTHEPEATDEVYCWCCANIDGATGNPHECNECGSHEFEYGPNADETGVQWVCDGCGEVVHPGCPTPFTPR